jgi:hypothetical protein
LRGKICDQRDLSGGERPNLLTIDADRADQFAVLQHRHGHEGTGTSKVDDGVLVVRGIGGDVFDMNDLPGAREPVETAAPVQRGHGFAPA